MYNNRLLTIGIIFVALGVLNLILAKYFVVYYIYLNTLFVRHLTNSRQKAHISKFFKSKKIKVFFRCIVYLIGICLILAGVSLIRVA